MVLKGVEEGERKRLLIAADIHDDSVQAMVAADLKLEALKQTAGPEAVPLVTEAQECVRGAAQRLRSLLFELAPIEPGLPLAEALDRYLKKSASGLSSTVVDRLDLEPPAETATVAYRIVQEAVTNVRKHASATAVSVELRQANDGLLVEIADNGKGFSTISSAPAHLGLTSMRIRAEQEGGWLAVDSQPGKGTRITFWLELPKLSRPGFASGKEAKLTAPPAAPGWMVKSNISQTSFGARRATPGAPHSSRPVRRRAR